MTDTDDAALTARRALAMDVVAWVKRWKTWTRDHNEARAYSAAMAELNANPNLPKFEVARIAINAAQPGR